MTDIEAEYDKAIAALSGTERVVRTARLFEEMRQMLATQVKRDNPELEGRALKIAAARRMYFAEEGVMKLLDKVS